MTNDLLDKLRSIAGKRHVLTGDTETRRFRQGYRYGGGQALAVVQPGTLVEMWRVAGLSQGWRHHDLPGRQHWP